MKCSSDYIILAVDHRRLGGEIFGVSRLGGGRGFRLARFRRNVRRFASRGEAQAFADALCFIGTNRLARPTRSGREYTLHVQEAGKWPGDAPRSKSRPATSTQGSLF